MGDAISMGIINIVMGLTDRIVMDIKKSIITDINIMDINMDIIMVTDTSMDINMDITMDINIGLEYVGN